MSPRNFLNTLFYHAGPVARLGGYEALHCVQQADAKRF